MIKEKNIILGFVLSFLTCGIYGIIWKLDITRDVDTISQNPNPRSGGLVILLTLITCGIYSFYWWYQNGELMEQANDRTRIGNASNGVLFLILCFVASFVNTILVQIDINKYAKAQMGYQQPMAPQPPMPPQPPVGPTM